MANERGSLEVAEVSSTLPRRRRRAQEWCHRAPGEKLHPDGLARASAIGQRRPDVLLFFSFLFTFYLFSAFLFFITLLLLFFSFYLFSASFCSFSYLFFFIYFML